MDAKITDCNSAVFDVANGFAEQRAYLGADRRPDAIACVQSNNACVHKATWAFLQPNHESNCRLGGLRI